VHERTLPPTNNESANGSPAWVFRPTLSEHAISDCIWEPEFLNPVASATRWQISNPADFPRWRQFCAPSARAPLSLFDDGANGSETAARKVDQNLPAIWNSSLLRKLDRKRKVFTVITQQPPPAHTRKSPEKLMRGCQLFDPVRSCNGGGEHPKALLKELKNRMCKKCDFLAKTNVIPRPPLPPTF